MTRRWISLVPFVDLGNAGVAVVALHREVPQVAVASVNLNGLMGDLQVAASLKP